MQKRFKILIKSIFLFMTVLLIGCGNTEIPETNMTLELDRYIESATQDYWGYGYSLDVYGDYIVATDSFGGLGRTSTIYKISDETYSRDFMSKAEGYSYDLRISGDYIVIYYETNSNIDSEFNGSIYIYKFSDESYERLIDGSVLGNSDLKAESIRISDDYLIIEAEDSVDEENHIFIYKLSNETYQREILIESDYTNEVIGVQEDYIFIASYYNYESAYYVYKLSDESYERHIMVSDKTDFGVYSSKVEVYDDYIIFSCVGYNNYTTGSIRIYKFSDESYERKIVGSEAENGDYFGSTIEYSGDYLIVVATGYSRDQGKVFVYKFSDEDYERQIYCPGEITGRESFGYFIAVKDNYFVIGAHGYNYRRGAAAIYKFDDESYERLIVEEDLTPSSFFGLGINIIDDYIFITAYRANEDQGAFYVYRFSDEDYKLKVTPNNDINATYFYLREITTNYVIVSSIISEETDSTSIYIYYLTSSIE